MARFALIQGRDGRPIEDHEVRAVRRPLESSGDTASTEVLRPRPDLVVMLGRDTSWERVVPGARSGSSVEGVALLLSSAADVPPALPRAAELLGPHAPIHLRRLPVPFVVIAWDEDDCRVFTDPLGKRAAWYSARPGQVVVGSEPHLVLAHPDVPRRPDLGVVAERLSYRPVTGDSTVFEGLALVEPGSMLEVQPTREPGRHRWHAWDLTVDHDRSADDWADEILATTERVLEREVGRRGAGRSVLHLSGGLDSSALGGVIADLGFDHDMVALTRSYPGLPCDESRYQDAVLETTGFQRRTTPPQPIDEDRDLLGPTAASRLPLLRIEPAERLDSEWASGNDQRSEFTGVGGDEMFDALNTTPLEALTAGQLTAGNLGQAVAGLRSTSLRGLVRDHREFLPVRWQRSRVQLRPWIPASLADDVGLVERFAGARRSPRPSEFPSQRLEWAIGGGWRSIQAESNERGLATRGTELVPLFLDPELIALALRVPDHLRRTDDDARSLQRRAFASRLPGPLRERRGKVHFDYRHALDLLDPAITAVAGDLALARAGLVDQRAFDRVVDDLATAVRRDIAGIPALAGPLWAVIGCEYWWRSEFH